jgi:hypothetical protein
VDDFVEERKLTEQEHKLRASALFHIWPRLHPGDIARKLADVLINTLALDFVYIQLNTAQEPRIEVVRAPHDTDISGRLEELNWQSPPLVVKNRYSWLRALLR